MNSILFRYPKVSLAPMMGRTSIALEPAEPLQRVHHLLGLEGELGRIGHVLEAAAAAAPKVWAGRLHALRRRLLDRVDDPAPEARARLHEADPEAIAGQAARDEDHVAIGPPDALAPEGQVVDRQGQNLPAFGSRHGSDTINVATI